MQHVVNLIKVVGKNGIKSTILADSINKSGSRLITYELEYPRFIHSEFMTHRMISKNSASSRAIPVQKMIDNIRESTAIPVHWGKNQAGMQADKEHNSDVVFNFNSVSVELENNLENNLESQLSESQLNDGIRKETHLDRTDAWLLARESAIGYAEAFSKAGYHKQIVNRLLEPFKMMKIICTATEYDNFFWLRCHKDAQPEIRELADTMYECRDKSEPKLIEEGSYHLPYVTDNIMKECDEYSIKLKNMDESSYKKPLELALMVSASCCAQVSYRRTDTSIDKAMKIYDQLVSSKPVHASPFEHQARPFTEEDYINFISNATPSTGITHISRDKSIWSSNFKGWIQYRNEIPNNTCWKYIKEQ